MNKLPYLLSIGSWKPDVEGYIESMKHIRDCVAPVTIEFQDHFQIIVPNGLRLLIGEKYPGDCQKYASIPFDVLDRDRWFIVANVHDARFQSRIPELEDEKVKIWVASEGVTFADSRYWNRVFDELTKYDRPAAPVLSYSNNNIDDMLTVALNSIADREICNVGLFAMAPDMMREFVTYMSENRDLFQGHEDTEQLLFNCFLAEHAKECGTKKDLFITMYANEKLGNCKSERGVIRSKEDQVFSVVLHNEVEREEK